MSTLRLFAAFRLRWCADLRSARSRSASSALPRDESLATAASFGESLSLLMWVESEWVRQRLPEMTTADPFGDVLVTTALTTNRTSTQLLDDLWNAIDNILDRLASNQEIEVGWRSDRSVGESVGDHLMTLLMWGAGNPWPERVDSFFSVSAARQPRPSWDKSAGA